jgi:hypothetical protein
MLRASLGISQRAPRAASRGRLGREAGDVTGNTARTVPLHEHLIEQGVTFAKAKGKGPLFYDPDGRRKVDDDPTNPRRRPWA